MVVAINLADSIQIDREAYCDPIAIIHPRNGSPKSINVIAASCQLKLKSLIARSNIPGEAGD